MLVGAAARAEVRDHGRRRLRRARHQDDAHRRAHGRPRPRPRLRPGARAAGAGPGSRHAARHHDHRRARRSRGCARARLPRRVRRRPRRRAVLESRRAPTQPRGEVAAAAVRPRPGEPATVRDPRRRGDDGEARGPARLRDVLARARGERDGRDARSSRGGRSSRSIRPTSFRCPSTPTAGSGAGRIATAPTASRPSASTARSFRGITTA